MTTITIWLIVLLSNTGQRIEMPNQYNTEKECVTAVQSIQQGNAGITGGCVATAITASEERAQQLINEEWWRSRPQEEETPAKGKP